MWYSGSIGGDYMEEKIYKKMYLHLFNVVTDVLEGPDLISPAVRLMLVKAQKQCEKMYIEADEKSSRL